MYMIVPLTIYLLERAVRLVLSHVRNTELIDVKLIGGGSDKVRRSGSCPSMGGGASPSSIWPP